MKVLLFWLLIITAAFSQTSQISGVVYDKSSGEVLPAANIQLLGTELGTAANSDGVFAFSDLTPGEYIIVVRFVGYRTSRETVVLDAGEFRKLSMKLEPTALLGKEVLTVHTRAREGESPVAAATLTRETLEESYYAQDIPVLLSDLPSSTFYSESGNGIGYNYISIRGFDQRRISVMINGVPQNDPEDHNVYWVNFPNFLDNVEDIQVQRGAGSAFYGPPAIGGSINIVTSNFSAEQKASANIGYGSLNTRKLSASYSTGLIDNRYVVSGRVSQITSDGYRDRSSVDFKSFFIGAARFGENSSLKLHLYGGPIEDELVFFGISKEEAENRETRRTNPLTRGDEIENFNQPHGELIHEWQINDKVMLKNTFFGIRGYGFFDFDGSWAPASYFRLTPEFGFDVVDPENFYVDDLLIRAYVDNRQGGWLQNLEYKNGPLTFLVGSELRFHQSLHWGRIQEGSNQLPQAISGDYSGLNYIGDRRYYEYKGGKNIVSPYVHAEYRFTDRLSGFADLQYVYMKYRLFDEAFLGNEFDVTYNFLNPRVALGYKLTPRTHLFGSFSRTSREPRLKNFYDAGEASTPESWGAVVPEFERNADGSFNFDEPLVQPETLNDIELGLSYFGEQYRGSLNLFYMSFNDEIIKSGQLDIFGQPVTGNAEQTLHAGVEVSAGFDFTENFSVSANTMFGRNELQRYSVFDFSGNEQRLDGNPIAGFPDFLANARMSYRKDIFSGILSMKHVGKQYTDNLKNEENTVDAYTVFNGVIAVDLSRYSGASGLMLQLHFQNLFDTLYITHGEGTSFFPAAERQIFANVKVNL